MKSVDFLVGILIIISVGLLAITYHMHYEYINFIEDVSDRTDNIITLSKDFRDAERYICDLKLELQLKKAQNSCMQMGYVEESEEKE